MKQWLSLTCPVCGFRHPLRKFNPTMKPILYPVQVVTGGGRAKGFRVAKYLPWSTLPTLRQTDVWTSLLCLYNRLAAAYDHFYQVLGFLSPKMRALLQLQKSYANAYRMSPFPGYARVYGSTGSSQDIVEAYPVPEDDYPQVYVHLFVKAIAEGV